MLIISIILVAIIFIVFLFISKSGINIDEINKMINRGDHEHARALLQKSLQSGKFSADAHFLMAKIYSHLNQDDYALMELKIIIKYNKFGPFCRRDEILEMMGDIYLKLNKLDEAHQQYLALEKLHPDDYNVISHLGKILFHKAKYEEAMGYYKKALELRPNDDAAVCGLGMIYFQTGDMKKAKDYLEQAVQLNRKNFTAHYYYALYYHKHQLFDYAISEYEKSVVDKSLRLKSLIGMAKCYQEKEVNVRAIENYELAVQLIEQTGDKIKDYNKRNSYFSDPSVLEIRYQLAQVYVYDKNFSAAIEQWQEINSINPEYKDVRQKINENSRFGKDRLQDFLIMKEMDFEKISRYMADYLGYTVKKLNMIGKEDVIMEVRPNSPDVFQGISLIFVKRSFNPIGEREISVFFESMQKKGIKNGLVISAAGVAPTGLRFALGKPIDFIGKSQVMRLLKKFEHRL